MNRRQELLEKYISEGMLLEDLIEMVVSLEDNVQDLEKQLSHLRRTYNKTLSKGSLNYGRNNMD